MSRQNRAGKYVAYAVAAFLLVGGFVYVSRGSGGPPGPAGTAGGVREENGKQIVDIRARGGYTPRTVTAKAGVPTIIRVTTAGTFDCSSALTVPAVGFRANLPPTGTTDIPVPAQTAGASVRGICAMGMYSFTINFN